MPFKDPVTAKEYKRQWYLANRERMRALNRKNYERDSDLVKARSKVWIAANRARHRLTASASQKRNPEARRQLAQERRARKRGAAVREKVVPLVLLEMHDGVCGICKEDVDPFEFHMDHRIPLALGGDHSYANMQPAHPSCNAQKGARLS